MGGTRANIGVVSAERKQQMKENYKNNKAEYNKKKIIRELQSNKRLFVKDETVEKYEWTAAQLAIVKEYNDRYIKERTIPRPIVNLPPPRVEPRPRPEKTPEVQLPDPPVITNRTYTSDMAIGFLTQRGKVNNYEKDTVEGQTKKISRLFKIFGVKTNDLMEIYNKHSVEYIRKTIEAEKSWKADATLQKWVGFGGLLAKDEKFRNIVGEEKTRGLKKAYDSYRDKNLKTTLEKRETKELNYREIYHGMFDAVKKHKVGTQAHAIALLYTHGMYADDERKELAVVPRNYFHTVLIVKSDNEMVGTRKNYYNTKSGRMLIGRFKTDKFFKVDYILPKKVKDAINTYVTKNNNTWLIEKVRGGGKYGYSDEDDDNKASGLGARIKSVMGYLITTMRPAVENYEIHVNKRNEEFVADKMAHSTAAQQLSYVVKPKYDEIDKYDGRRVSVRIDEGPNKGKTITGTIGLNDGANPDYTPGQRPYTIEYDSKFKEPPEYVNFPDETINFLDGSAPKNKAKPKKKAKPKPKPKANVAAKPKAKPSRKSNRGTGRNRR